MSKAQLDGACNDKRYSDDFFIDLIFEECSAAMASKHLLSAGEKDSEDESHVRFATNTPKIDANIQNEAASRRMGGTIAGSTNCDGVIITASAYDSMVHRDSRFWDVISERRKKIAASGSFDAEKTSDVVPFYGPTIGRRREFANEVKSDKSTTEESFQSNDVASHRSIQSFSIGGELDFTVDGTSNEETKNTGEEVASPKEIKKDDLMEALMAIDDDIDADRNEDSHSNNKENETEEIVFDVNLESVQDKECSNNNETCTVDVKVESEPSENKVNNTNDEIDSSKSKQSSCDTSLVQVDDLDLVDSGDQFDFDDDDAELQDLEDFLTKAKS